MTSYKIKLNVEGGESLDLNLDKEQFENLSALLEQIMPDRKWKTESIKPIEA